MSDICACGPLDDGAWYTCRECRIKNTAGVAVGMTDMSTEAERRKATPIFSGVLKYFPDAIAEVAKCSKAGNDQHNLGSELHWDRSKSGDDPDALSRHLLDIGKIDSDGIRHSAKVAWRALAILQKEIEGE